MHNDNNALTVEDLSILQGDKGSTFGQILSDSDEADKEEEDQEIFGDHRSESKVGFELSEGGNQEAQVTDSATNRQRGSFSAFQYFTSSESVTQKGQNQMV